MIKLNYRVVLLTGPPLNFLSTKSLYNCRHLREILGQFSWDPLLRKFRGGPVKRTTLYVRTVSRAINAQLVISMPYRYLFQSEMKKACLATIVDAQWHPWTRGGFIRMVDEQAAKID